MLLVTAVVAVIAGVINYQRESKLQVALSEETIHQLVVTVSKSASIATYLYDEQLAEEVLHGLMANDIVSSVALIGIDNILASAGNPLSEATKGRGICEDLPSPFSEGEKVGQLCIYPSYQLIHQRAESWAREQTFSLMITVTLLMGLLMVVLHYLYSVPIKTLSQHLHRFQLSDYKALSIPAFHRLDEIGDLYKDSNLLLQSISEAFQRERALRREMERLESLFRNIFEKASGGIALLDLSGKLMVVNPSFERLLGAASINQLKSGAKRFAEIATNKTELAQILVEVAQTEAVKSLDIGIVMEDGYEKWLHLVVSKVTEDMESADEEDGAYLEVLVYDVSERRHREAQFKTEAERDLLTGVLNRRAGLRKTEALLKRMVDSGHHCAIMMMDLDKFKPLNDTYGHDAGDKALRIVADRLCSVVRNQDLVIRWGGDEFVLVTTLLKGIEDAEVMALRIVSAFKEKIHLNDEQEAELGISIGISIFPEHGNTIDELLQCADKAMYRAKMAEGNQYRIYH